MTEVQLLKKIGERIRLIREEKGITQDNLGIAMSMDRPKTMMDPFCRADIVEC